MKASHLLSYILIIIHVPAISTLADNDNLVANGTFEQLNDTHLPVGWLPNAQVVIDPVKRTWIGGDPLVGEDPMKFLTFDDKSRRLVADGKTMSFWLDTQQPYEGNYSAMVSSTESREHVVRWVQQNLQLPMKSVFELSFAYRTQDMPASGAKVFVYDTARGFALK